MQNIYKIFIIFYIFSVSILHAQTYISGSVSGTWNSSGNPYYITDTITIETGNTLIINPGVEIYFQGAYPFLIEGTLTAIGTPEDSILFTVDTNFTSEYRGIRFFSNASDASIISYSTIEYGNAIGPTYEDQYGGGIAMYFSPPTISHCTLRYNSSSLGGGIAIIHSSATVENCKVYNNSSTGSSGGIHVRGAATIRNNEIFLNSAIGIAGGLQVVDSYSPRIENNLIYNNSANDGGGLAARMGNTGIIINNLIYNNSASDNGGGIYVFTEGTNLNCVNNIVWNNSAVTNGHQGYVRDGTLNIDYSDIQDGSPGIYTGPSGTLNYGSNNINSDPVFNDSINFDFHIQLTSPVIELGTNVDAPSIDFDGNTRPFDGDHDEIAIVDIGPYEYINTPPSITSTPVLNAIEDYGYTYDVNADDVDAAEVLTFEIIQNPGFLSIVDTTGVITGAPDNNDVGPQPVTVQVSDLNGATDTQNYTLTVANTNDPPTMANPIPDQQETEDVAYSYTFPLNTFNDVDNGDILTYSAILSDDSPLPAWLTFTPGTRSLSGTPANSDVGTITVKVMATDNSEASVFDEFGIEVLNTNDPPTVANPIVDQQATEDVAFNFIFAANTFNDVDVGDALTYAASLSDDSPLPAWLTFTPGTRTFSGTPSNTDIGTITVKVTATDNSEASVFDEFELEVLNANDPPTVANPIVDQQATEDVAFNFIFAANTFDDVDVGDVLTYLATLSDDSPLPAWLTFTPGTRTFSGTPTNSDAGTITVKVTATDNSEASVFDEFELEVLNTNDSPTVANPIVDQQATEEVAYSFTFPLNTFNDVDAGDILTYSATLSDDNPLPAWLTFTPATRTFSGTPTNSDVGTITVKVTATDNSEASVSDEFDLEVLNENDPPTVANPISDQQATEDVAYSFAFAAITFNDVDAGDILTYSATLSDDSPLPTWLTFTPGTRTFSGTPANGDVGTITVKVTATDNSEASVSDEFDLEVLNENDPPTVANEIPDQQATEDVAYSFTFPLNTFNDADAGDILTYSATLSNDSPLPTWLTFTPGTRTFSGTPANGDVGTITVKVTATDTSEASVFNEFDLEVINTNDPPVISGLNTQVFNEDETLTYTISELLEYVDDPDHPDSLLFFMPYPGENVTVSLVEDTLVVFSAPENWNGFDTLAVIVTDGELADSALIFFEVKPVNDAPFFVGLPEDTVDIYLMAEWEQNIGNFADDYDFDMPGDSLRWEVSVSDTTLKIDFDPITKDLTLTAPDYADVFTVTITVTDDSGATAEGPFYVNVTYDPTAIENLENGIPTSYVLKQNYPNPFNPTTHIKFGIPQAGDVLVEVYNLLGQKIVTLFDGYKSAGYHVVDFDASNLPTGIYFYRIKAR